MDARAGLRTPERDGARIGLWLVGATLAYNVLEALVGETCSESCDSI